MPWVLLVVAHREDELVLREGGDLVDHVLRAQLPRVGVHLLVEDDQLDVLLPEC